MVELEKARAEYKAAEARYRAAIYEAILAVEIIIHDFESMPDDQFDDETDGEDYDNALGQYFELNQRLDSIS